MGLTGGALAPLLAVPVHAAVHAVVSGPDASISAVPAHAATTEPPAPLPNPARVDVRVSRNEVSRPLPSGFVGFSFEFRAVREYTGSNPHEINPRARTADPRRGAGTGAGAADRRQQHRRHVVADRPRDARTRDHLHADRRLARHDPGARGRHRSEADPRPEHEAGQPGRDRRRGARLPERHRHAPHRGAGDRQRARAVQGLPVVPRGGRGAVLRATGDVRLQELHARGGQARQARPAVRARRPGRRARRNGFRTSRRCSPRSRDSRSSPTTAIRCSPVSPSRATPGTRRSRTC